MLTRKARTNLCNLLVFVCWLEAFAVWARAQTPAQPGPDEVLRVYTDLVQTDFMVLNKSGRFVEGLKRENFQLMVDGKPVPIRFFEQIKAGARNEEAQLAAARGERHKENDATNGLPDRGRAVFFFVDDMHLSPSSLDQTTRLLLRFIERDLKQNDEAEIASASGRLGFLQQLTDSPAVLTRAVQRLNVRVRSTRDLQQPPMSEFDALQVDRGDRDAFGYFVDYVMQNRMISRQSAEAEVRQRASMILEQAAYSSTTTLSSLEVFVRDCSKLPGRKLMFLISDGFFIDTRHSNTTDRMRTIISASARAGVVIYSIDARGLIADLRDAGSNDAVDRTHRLQRSRMGEVGQAQDVLNSLARDTGGRALFDNNDLSVAVENGLRETSQYYVAAWQPLSESANANKFRQLSLSVIARPDLIVRVRRGMFDVEPPAKKTTATSAVKAPERTADAKLRDTITSRNSKGDIPVFLTVNYLDVPNNGMTLSISMQIPADFISSEIDSQKPAPVDLAGAVFDEQGNSTRSFRQQITIQPAIVGRERPPRDLTYTHRLSLLPGLYQVRVAVHDSGSGRVGVANSWVEIPDLAKSKFALSSLLVGERANGNTADLKGPGGPLPDSVLLRIDRRFSRNAFLRYVVFIYNAQVSASNSRPDIVTQIQILRNDQPVATTGLRQVSTEGIDDLLRIPQAAELRLDGLPAGRYVLRFTAVDRVARLTASQQLRFEIQ